eukprot:TRINITY_DN7610_c0_g1_i1.p1 TRINITY_DN7610_c0_g1~~TRINITY_DN7610_c0_g1_i1.p1  ORF type:complete len:365 (+),score=57.28 TRINITY_DN7610_c0_g1_i1:60-1097(+)
MKAIGQTAPGNADVLKVIELEVPVADGRDIVVKLAAVAINPVDTKIREGAFGTVAAVTESGKPYVGGWDGSGVVTAVGSDAILFAVGDEVYFSGVFSRQSCHAEYVAIDERIVGKKPKTLSHADAAALPLTTLTAWEALIEQAAVPIPASGASESGNHNCLIIGGAGGVGSIATQIAKKVLKFEKVVATASRPETKAWCEKNFADFVINHREPLGPQLKEVAGIGAGEIDVLFVTANPDQSIDQWFDMIRPCARIVMILPPSNPVNLGTFFTKRVNISLELMFTRPLTGWEQEKQGKILNDLAAHIDGGEIHTTRNKTYDLFTQFKDAHTEQESGKAIGKIVLTL